jgi:putative flippase GtrA
MKIKELLAAVVGLAAAIGAIYFFYRFVTFEEAGGGHRFGWYSLGLAVVAFICGLVYFLGHVNQEEEIHITQ